VRPGADAGAGADAWRQTGRVATGRTGARAARCSSAKKTVLGVYAWAARGRGR
jgi:hypothetical protein